jgi:hypothetical protein
MFLGSFGVMVQPKLKAKFCAIVMAYSPFAEKHSLAFKIEKGLEKWVHILNMAIVDGVRYYLPIYGLTGVCAIVGIGNTRDEAAEECKEHCEGISADSLDIKTSALDDAIKVTKEGEKFGIPF